MISIGSSMRWHLPRLDQIGQTELSTYQNAAILGGMGSDAKRGGNPLGPVGGNVMDNVRLIREGRGLSYARLSGRLSELGRSIAVLGLARIERGERRVDADDLVALALALDVNPAALLLPRMTPAGDDPVALTPAVTWPAEKAWGWVAGTTRDVHGRPEYAIREELEWLDDQVREAREDPRVEEALPGAERFFAERREDLDKIARDALPGFASAERAAAYDAWLGRLEEEVRRQDEERREREEEDQEERRRRLRRHHAATLRGGAGAATRRARADD
jgi:hypothetical protein